MWGWFGVSFLVDACCNFSSRVWGWIARSQKRRNNPEPFPRLCGVVRHQRYSIIGCFSRVYGVFMNKTFVIKIESFFQTWSDSTKYKNMETRRFPTRSGITGILLACLGVQRKNSINAIESINSLSMAVREDRRGQIFEDVQTAHPPFNRADGNIEKNNHNLTFRNIIADASYHAAISGPEAIIDELIKAVKNPIFKPFLGKKAFVPTCSMFAGISDHESVIETLSCWKRSKRSDKGKLLVEVENEGEDQKLVKDVIKTIDPYLTHNYRRVGTIKVDPPYLKSVKEKIVFERNKFNLSSELRDYILSRDNNRCVCCGDTARDVHHLTYRNSGNEKPEELASLCGLCHMACTRIEYALSMGVDRVNPYPDSPFYAEITKVRDIIISEM